MSDKRALTMKQKYLEFLIPSLNDAQVNQMIDAVNNASTCKKSLSAKSVVIQDPYDTLMSMVGCDNAKRKLTEMVADYRMSKITAARGKSVTKAHYHAVFTGNPGCAKTTVARLYAKILANEGVTQNNRFEEVSRPGLIGKYAGTTASKVDAVFKRNKGGVIFIDEAYALCEGEYGRGNYGEEAINEIIVCLENNPDTVVIFAGYPDRMESFLSANPGLRSRIPYHVVFNDYSTEELVAISRIIANEKGFELTASAEKKLASIYNTAKQDQDFGNGRYVRNVIEEAVRTKAIDLGVMKASTLEEFADTTLYSDEKLFSLDENCIVTVPTVVGHVKKQIGFMA